MRTLAYSAGIKSHFIKPGMCLLYSNLVYNNDLNLRQLSTTTSNALLDLVAASLSFKTKTNTGKFGRRSRPLRGFHPSSLHAVK